VWILRLIRRAIALPRLGRSPGFGRPRSSSGCCPVASEVGELPESAGGESDAAGLRVGQEGAQLHRVLRATDDNGLHVCPGDGHGTRADLVPPQAATPRAKAPQAPQVLVVVAHPSSGGEMDFEIRKDRRPQGPGSWSASGRNTFSLWILG